MPRARWEPLPSALELRTLVGGPGRDSVDSRAGGWALTRWPVAAACPLGHITVQGSGCFHLQHQDPPPCPQLRVFMGLSPNRSQALEELWEELYVKALKELGEEPLPPCFCCRAGSATPG